MTKKISAENVVYVVNGSATMFCEKSSPFSLVMNSLRKHGVKKAVVVASDTIETLSLRTSSKKLAHEIGNKLEDAKGEDARKLLDTIAPDTKIVFFEDGDLSRRTSLGDDSFINVLADSGHRIEVISLDWYTKFKRTSPAMDLWRKGVAYLNVQHKAKAVDEAVSRAINGNLTVPQGIDLRPQAILDAESVLHEELDRLEERRRSHENRIKRDEKEVSRLKGNVQTQREYLRSINSEFKKVGKAFDALRTAKPAARKIAAKKGL